MHNALMMPMWEGGNEYENDADVGECGRVGWDAGCE